ncbi:Tetratricopeptide repeat-containing protein [Azospirillum oryzae]|uniref:Tetratricopeptide repeat-containing protein n=1 Tax=Azospirillum oryzae TaxID=286727 RepID=A0A1X7F2K0_9PROT|nr:tetratricopeptide repeat protein [Azospirillum oryzae]SMF44313.1 Tetratricopeptide repeat-containing protein [Azospirillum oryzae]
MATVQEALVAALDHQEAGRFAKADLLYRRILAASPGHPHALHLWGILAALTGRPEEAMDRIRRAIAAAPDIADFHVNLARVEAALNRPDHAARLYATAVVLQPEAVETRFQLAGLLQDLGRPDEAEEQYDALLTVAPLHASIHLNRALLREAQGRFAGARDGFRAALVLEPAHAKALLRLAATERELGRGGAALATQRRAMTILDDPAKAGLFPPLATLLADEGLPERAVQAMRIAVALTPGDPALWNELANRLKGLGRLAESVAAYGRGLGLLPGNPVLLNNRADGWLKLGRLEPAEADARAAVAANPGFAGGWNTLGSVLMARGRAGEALGAFEQAVNADGDAPQARFNRSIALLTLGRLAEGWDDYELGWAVPSGRFPRAEFPQPLWDGRPLGDGRLLVWGEQGLGDEVMFASLIPQLAGEGVRVVLDCDARLAPLLSRGLPGVTVVARREPPDERLTAPDVVAQIPAGSLPRLMRRRIEDFAGRQPAFLKADPGRVAELRRRLEDGRGDGRRLIGVSWSSKNAAVGHLRSIPLARLAKALERPDVGLVSLQYGDVAAEAAAAGVTDPGLDAWGDIDGLAALIAAMDLVVSVDNSTVHLAGGLGRPAWALLPHSAEWRWMQGRHDTVWYPSVRLFRQTAPGDWDGVLRELGEAMREG